MSTTIYLHQPLLTLFSDANFAGSHKHWYGQGGTEPGADNNPFLADFNDITSSLIIHNGVWKFCADADFKTPYQTNVDVFVLGPGRYALIEDHLGPGSNDSMSSFFRVDGLTV